jgi:hypothetical protein
MNSNKKIDKKFLVELYQSNVFDIGHTDSFIIDGIAKLNTLCDYLMFVGSEIPKKFIYLKGFSLGNKVFLNKDISMKLIEKNKPIYIEIKTKSNLLIIMICSEKDEFTKKIFYPNSEDR